MINVELQDGQSVAKKPRKQASTFKSCFFYYQAKKLIAENFSDVKSPETFMKLISLIKKFNNLCF